MRCTPSSVLGVTQTSVPVNARTAIRLVSCAIALAAPATAAARPVPSLDAVAEARRYVARADGAAQVSFAVIGTRGRLYSLNGGRIHQSASQTKAMLLVGYLRRLGRRPVPPAVKPLLSAMIRRSDNRAAHQVRPLVGDAGLASVGRAAGMRNLQLNGTWSNVGITAVDQARFFLRFDRLCPRRHRPYARRLLGSVVAPQRWGIPRAARRHPLEVFVKGGWRRGLVNQGALLETGDDRRLSIVVLTSGLPFAQGTHAIEVVARKLLRAPRRVRPRRTRFVPDAWRVAPPRWSNRSTRPRPTRSTTPRSTPRGPRCSPGCS